MIIACWGWFVAFLIALLASWSFTAPMLAVGDYQAEEIECRREHEERHASRHPASAADDEEAKKKAASEREKEAREYCVQRRSAIAGERQGDIARWAAGVSFLALLAAAGAVYAGFRTVGTMQETAVAQLRAYVHFNGMRWISHPGPNGVIWRIRPRWTNTGTTPTRNLHVRVAYWIDDKPLPEDFAFGFPAKDELIPAVLRPNGEIEGQHNIVHGDVLQSVKDGKKHIFVWGQASYRDTFPGTPLRITRFCVHATAVTGDPRRVWDDNRNIVDILFATYRKHNCADEDCSGQDAT